LTAKRLLLSGAALTAGAAVKRVKANRIAGFHVAYFSADREDRAGAVGAKSTGRENSLAVDARSNCHVDAIDGGGFQLDDDIVAGSQLRFVNFLIAQLIDAAVGVNLYSLQEDDLNDW